MKFQGVQVPALGLSAEVSMFFGDHWRVVGDDGQVTYRVSRGGARFYLFCARFIRHTKGRWAGEPFLLEAWELFMFSEMLRAESEGVDGTFIELTEAQVNDPAAVFEQALREQAAAHPGVNLDKRPRAYSDGYVQLPKKNGKSGIASSFLLYMLVADGEVGAEVYAAASAKDQAKIVHGQSRKMVKASQRLSKWLKVYRDAIEEPASGSTFKVISADAGVNEGLEPSAYACDEYHRHKTRELYDVLTKGTVSRARPFGLVITNPGAATSSPCGELYLQAVAVRDGKPGHREDLYVFFPEVNPDFLKHPSMTVGDPVPDDFLDAWKAVNPASWITRDTLAKEYKKSPWHVFSRFNLNMWTRAEKSWLPPGAWEACIVAEFDRGEWTEGVAAVDLGSSHDSTGIALVMPLGLNEDGKMVADVTGWIMQAHSDPEKPPPLAHEVVEGDRVPIALVEARLEALGEEFDIDELAYDPWRFARSAELLEPVFHEVVEYPQTNERMCPASQKIYDAIIEGRAHVDGHPALAAHIAAAVAADTERGWRLKKLQSREAQDFAIALAVAWDRAEQIAGVRAPSVEGVGR